MTCSTDQSGMMNFFFCRQIDIFSNCSIIQIAFSSLLKKLFIFQYSFVKFLYLCLIVNIIPGLLFSNFPKIKLFYFLLIAPYPLYLVGRLEFLSMMKIFLTEAEFNP